MQVAKNVKSAIVVKLSVTKSKKKKDEFETLWAEVMEKRMELNTEAQYIPSLVESTYFTEVEEASCPRASIVALRHVNESEDDAKEAY